MCTSFIKTTDDNCYISMNFDNNGMNYSINTRKKDWFIVYVDIGKRKSPSFGVHKSGMFFNNLMVDACEKGNYRRGKGVVHSARLLTDIIDGKICIDDLEQYLHSTEIVNVPDWSTHNMLCGTKNNVWILEPGRGNYYSPLKPNEFQVMTNFSLIEDIQDDNIFCERYHIANNLLMESANMSVDKAFEILEAVKQSEGEWITEFSMVYDKSRKTVYYCNNQDFTNIQKFLFQ